MAFTSDPELDNDKSASRGYRDTLWSVHPGNCSERLIMAIRAYFDESEDKDHKVHAIGGFIGRADDWQELETRWMERLIPTGVRAFHLIDCENGYREFSESKGWTKEARFGLIRELIDLILEYEIYLIGCGVLLEPYEKMAPLDNHNAKVGGDKWLLPFQEVLQEAASQAEALPINEQVAFFFDFKETHQFRASALFAETQSDERLGLWRQRLGTITFGHKEFERPGSIPLLQIADIAAVETRKAIGNPITHPHLSTRRSLQRFVDKNRVARIAYLDGDMLRKIHALKLQEINSTKGSREAYSVSASPTRISLPCSVEGTRVLVDRR